MTSRERPYRKRGSAALQPLLSCHQVLFHFILMENLRKASLSNELQKSFLISFTDKLEDDSKRKERDFSRNLALGYLFMDFSAPGGDGGYG